MGRNLKLHNRVELLFVASFLALLMTVLITFVFLVDRQWILAILAAIGGTVAQWLVIRKAWHVCWTEESLKTDIWLIDRMMLSIGIAVTLVGWSLMLTSSGFFSSIEQGGYTAGGIGIAGLVTLIVGHYFTVFSWQRQKKKGTWSSEKTIWKERVIAESSPEKPCVGTLAARAGRTSPHAPDGTYSPRIELERVVAPSGFEQE